ncbi:MAG: hypothetical protein IPM42_09890 [Saprospiraceae bacterium]|nr:hypothetical protein [Saprospiraceae bacterium]
MYYYAIVGALLPEILKLIEGKFDPNFPSHLKQLPYYVAVTGQIVLGVFTYHLLADQVGDNPIMSVACGYGGATILSKILGKIVDLLSGGQENKIAGRKMTFSDYWKL